MSHFLQLAAQAPPQAKAIAIAIAGRAMEFFWHSTNDGSITLTQEQMDTLTRAITESNARSRQLQEQLEMQKKGQETDNRHWKIILFIALPCMAMATTLFLRTFTSCDGRGR